MTPSTGALKEALRTRLRELISIHGVSGSEQPVVRYLREAFAPLCERVEVDSFGNLYAVREGRSPEVRLMLVAHSDEIGCAVKYIEPSGFLRLDRIGGVTPSLWVGRKVRVNDVFGVVGVTPGHLPRDGNQETRLADLYVDVGVNSAEEVARLGIRVGDPISFEGELSEFANSDLVCGRAVDNRIGCAVLLQLLENLSKQELPATLYATVSVQEEVGLRGAQVAAYRVNPGCALAVDTIPAGDTPEVEPKRDLPIYLGRGPVIAAVQGDWRLGSIIHPAVKAALLAAAESAGVPYQLALFPFAWNDACSMHMVREGIPAGSVAMPRRYSHSPVEMLDLNDAANTVRLLEAVTPLLLSEEKLSFL